jgi:tetratricopeptide (TPR) repeat protein
MATPRRASYYYGNLGINYHFFFKLPEAQAAYLTAIQHMEKIEDLSESESNMLATIYYNLYILFSFTDLAILDRSYLDRAMELYQKNNHIPGLIFCYGAMIDDLDKQGKTLEALEYAKIRMKLAEDTDNLLQTGLSASITGLLYAKLHDRASSDAFFARAHDILFGRDIVTFHAVYYDEKAQAHLALGEYEEAIKYFHKALDQYFSMASTLNLSKLYKLLSEAYEKSGKYPEAIEYQRKYSQVLLDNFKVDKVLYMGAVQKDFEKEHKERETNMLRQKNEEIQLYVNQLEQSNEELKQFAHAASHDLREPVRMIVSYTELLEITLKDKLNGEQQEFFNYLRGGWQAGSMRSISGILTFSKVNSHDEMTKVDLNETMQKVKENMKLAIVAKNAKIDCDKLPVVKSNSVLMIQLFPKSHLQCDQIQSVR